MSLSAYKYSTLKLTLRAMLSGNTYSPNPTVSEPTLLSFIATLLSNASGAAALTTGQCDSLTSTLRSQLASGLLGPPGVPSVMDITYFLVDLASDANGAAVMPVAQYDVLFGLLRASLSDDTLTYPQVLPEAAVHSYMASGPEGFSPRNCANLALWLDGRTSGAFSDLAGALPATSTGRVRRVDQPAPLSGSWLAPSDDQRVFHEASANAFDVPGGSTALMAPAATIYANNATLGFCVTERDRRYGGDESLFIGTIGGLDWGLTLRLEKLAFRYQSVAWDTGIVCPINAQMEGVVRVTATGFDAKVYVNGVLFSASLLVSLPPGSVTNMTTGQFAGQFGTYEPIVAVAQLVAYQSAIGDADRDALLTWLRLRTQRAPAVYPADAPFVIVEGDSIATSNLQLNTYQAWPMRAQHNLWPVADLRLQDVAISGSKIADVAARYTTSVLPLLSSSRAKNIVVLAIGTNSLDHVKTAAAYLADLYSLADAIRAAAPANTKIIGQTLLPRTIGAFGTPATFEADRQIWNGAIRTGFAAHLDAIADVASVVGMGAAGDDTNTTNYQDGLHPTVIGSDLTEPMYRGSIQLFI